MVTEMENLKKKANLFRQEALKMMHEAGSGHPGGTLSAVEIITVLYFQIMHHNPKDPKWEDRDRFILSKGHASACLYAVLAECGYFSKEAFRSFRKTSGMLQGMVEPRRTPGIETASGSLGHGLSEGLGMALGIKYLKKDCRVFVLLGDGETQEGQVWEAAMAASHFELDNLTAILDHNQLQVDGLVSEVMNIEPLVDKWRSFGWTVIRVDGHNIEELVRALKEACSIKGKPTIIIADTIKGKGVSYMENIPHWHGTRVPNSEELAQAIAELKGELDE